MAEHLPAGALLTVETKDAGGMVKRFGGLLSALTGEAQGQGKGDRKHAPNGASANQSQIFSDMLGSSIAKEAVVGVFAVGQTGRPFSPGVLGVSRVNQESQGLFSALLPKKAGAKVGKYEFARQGSVFAGMSGGLVYFSTDKALLMSYLGRLSGKDAPRLLNSLPYTTSKRSVGAQEMSLFMNFSATAKVLRSQLAQMSLPRLFSPAVDALDTLGQYAGGFNTTDKGFTTTSALVANAQGKDQPLYRILTDSTEFHVQEIIPAQIESVKATACAPESGAYFGRWLTRLDLFDPTGFLTDSQLASHLEQSGQYLGHECAQVTLVGSTKSGFAQPRNPLASLGYIVSYQRVRDLDAAKAHLPSYVNSVNTALARLADSLSGLLKEDGLSSLTSALPAQAAAAGQLGNSALSGLVELDQALKNLKMVYAFRGDYLITAFSPEALQTALDESAAPLAQDSAFQAAQLSMTGAGWSYQSDPPEITPADFQALLPDPAQSNELDLDTSDLTDEERAALEALLSEDDAGGSLYDQKMLGVFTELMNRYDGMVSQKQVMGNVVLTKSDIKYRW